MAAEEFPSFPNYDESSLVEISAASLQDLVDRTVFSVAQEGESQFNLTGLLVEKNNPPELADSIIRLLKNRDLKDRLGKNAKEKVSQQYDLKNVIKKYEDLYVKFMKESETP